MSALRFVSVNAFSPFRSVHLRALFVLFIYLPSQLNSQMKVQNKMSVVNRLPLVNPKLARLAGRSSLTHYLLPIHSSCPYVSRHDGRWRQTIRRALHVCVCVRVLLTLPRKKLLF